MRHGRRRRGEERRAECPSHGSVRSSAFIRGGRKKQTLIKTGDVVGNEARGAQAMVENLNLDLSSVGVTGKRKLDAEFGGAIERIWIVGQRMFGMSRRISGSTFARVCCLWPL